MNKLKLFFIDKYVFLVSYLIKFTLFYLNKMMIYFIKLQDMKDINRLYSNILDKSILELSEESKEFLKQNNHWSKYIENRKTIEDSPIFKRNNKTILG